MVVSNASDLLSHLRRRLDYDPEKGAFYRKDGFTGVIGGKPIGSPTSQGKRQAAFLGVRYQVDRLVWLWETGSLPVQALLHIDGDNGNDRFGNLREGRKGPTLPDRGKQFFAQAEARFGASIDLSRLEYKGSGKPAQFTCYLHGPFTRKPRELLRSTHGCPVCCQQEATARARKAPEEKRATTLARWQRQRERRLKSGGLAASVKRWRARIKVEQPERWEAMWRADVPRKRAWGKTNKGRKYGRLQRQRRRARLKDITSVGVTGAQWDTVCAAHVNDAGEVCCKYCKQPCSPTIDHVVPIARGGRHEPSNVVPACGGCNSSKAAHLIHEWPKARRLLAQHEFAALMLHTTRHLCAEHT